ncbi:MAG: hypothetical protein SFZ03_00285 [Candidatus Melainabacteria bacterium]|nr:hypothetical protein [Candidatus Melainabacteria bacterium]
MSLALAPMSLRLSSKARLRRSAKGQGTIELVGTVFISALLMLALAMLSIFLYLQHNMVSAARDGVRVAALNSKLGSSDPSEVAEGQQEVLEHVQNYIQSMTGISVGEPSEAGDDGVTIVPPDLNDPQGERSVTVQVRTSYTPISMSNSGEFQEFSVPLAAQATMRYEE